MEERKKGLKELWDDIDTPVAILILWAIVSLFFPLTDYISNSIVASIIGFLISFLIFGYIGFSLAKAKREKDATRAGAYAGAIVGLVGAAASIFAFYFMPELFSSQIAQATKQGADAETVKTFMKFGIFAGLVISPVISGLIGAFSSWLASIIFKDKKKKRRL